MGGRVATLGLGLVVTLGVAACAGPVEVVSANSQAVTIRHTPDASYQSDDYAQKYCGQYNKAAHWRSTAPEPTNQELTIYDCVPM